MEKLKGVILCVDDDQDTRDLLTALLGSEGYEVIAIGTVAEALWRAMADKLDLILLDWVLEDGSGIELCMELRRIGIDAPILFYSGVGNRDEIQNAMRAGAQGFLVKPAAFEDVLQNVSRFIPSADQSQNVNEPC
jgi:DNA-binding response OmpR family regulator